MVTFLSISASGILALRFSREREPLRTLHRTVNRQKSTCRDTPGTGRPHAVEIASFLRGRASRTVRGDGRVIQLASLLGGHLRSAFALKDPAFGPNVGFFVFRLPLLEELRDLFLLILVLTALVTIAVYWARDAFNFRESPPRIPSRCAAHLSVLLGIFFIQRALSYFLARCELTLHGNGVVFGLRYVDHVLWQPGLWLLAALAIAAAGICVFNLRERGLRLPVAAAVLVFAPALVLNLLQPAMSRCG